MALTEYEEHVIEALEAQFQTDDAARFERFAARPAQAPRRDIPRLAPALACFLGGVALLVAVRHAGFLVKMSNVSGLPSSSITRAVGVIGCVMLFASAVMLQRHFRSSRPGFDRAKGVA